MTDKDRAALYCFAIHEAGHAVVMEKLGIGVREVRLDGTDDNPCGGADALNPEHKLCPIKRVAAWIAGIEAEKIFECPTPTHAKLVDKGWIDSILSRLPPAEREPCKEKGRQHARCLIQQHKAKLERLAALLVQQRKVSRSKFLDLMNS